MRRDRDIYMLSPNRVYNWFDRHFMDWFPHLFLRFVLWRKRTKTNVFRVDKLLRKSKRFDIKLLASGNRGFIITLDNEVQLHFYQEGNHFVYDGWEAGEYDDGDVTIFDGIEK